MGDELGLLSDSRMSVFGVQPPGQGVERRERMATWVGNTRLSTRWRGRAGRMGLAAAHVRVWLHSLRNLSWLHVSSVDSLLASVRVLATTNLSDDHD